MTLREPIETALRVTPTAKQAEEWVAVLAASGIAHRLEETGAGWALVVAARDAQRARDALVAYEEEARAEEAVEVSPPSYGPTWIGIGVAAVLIGVFAVTGPRDGGSAWFDRGAASAGSILKGEVWRTVTALTLHFDLIHVLGNALASAVFVTGVGWCLGPGIGSWLVLLAGAGGNALAALAYGSPHLSAGASTAVFGAVGILAARQVVVRRQSRSTGRKAWVVVAASLALLGLLGTGTRADLLGHLFGLLVGGVLGLATALAVRRLPGPGVQWALTLAAAAMVVGAWRIALR
jgi:rhomboid protease GluP